MDNDKTFQAVTDDVLVSLISEAQKRVIFIAPGVRGVVADALISAARRLPRNVSVILDIDPEVCRLGYGEIDALKKLQEFRYDEPNLYANPKFLLAQPGVRIGVLIVDDDTLFYSPTPLLIEAGPTNQSNFSQTALKPNGIMIRAGVSPSLVKACAPNVDSSTREIGHENVKDLDIKKAADSLKECPPKKFDLARQERVFSSKLCFMELEIANYKIASKTIKLDSALFVFDKDTQKRLSNRFKAFDEEQLPKNVKYVQPDGRRILISMESIEKEIEDLRKEYLIPVGKWGKVILRSRMDEFKSKVKEVENKLKCYKDCIQKVAFEIAQKAYQKLAEDISPKVLKKPPRELVHRLALVAKEDVKIQIIQDYISKRSDREVGRLLKAFNPKTEVISKDITYQTFSDPEFVAYLEKPEALGEGCIKRIFEEHDSVREAEDGK